MCGVVFWVFSVVWLECTRFDVFERYLYKIRIFCKWSYFVSVVSLAYPKRSGATFLKEHQCSSPK